MTTSRRGAAAWSLTLSYLGQAVSIVKGIVLVPLYIRHFGLELYGAWLASANIVAMLGLMELGVSSVFYQRLGHAFGARDFKKFASLVAAGAMFMLCLVPLFMGVALSVAFLVPGVVNAPASTHRTLVTTFLLVSAATVANLGVTNSIAITHAWQRTAIGGVARLAGQLAEVVALLLALRAGQGLVALGVGAALGAAVALAITAASVAVLWVRLGLPRPRLDAVVVRELAGASVQVAVSRIAAQVAGNVETTIIAAMRGPSAAALYGVTERVFRLAAGLVNPIAGSTLSAFAHLVGERGPAAARGPLRELSVLWSTAVALVFPLLLVINREFITLWLGADKFGGQAITVLICASSIVSTRVFLAYVCLIAVGDIARASWAMTAESVGRVGLMFIGLHFIGLPGVPLASLLGGAVLAYLLLPRLLSLRLSAGDSFLPPSQFAGHRGVFAAFVCGVLLAAVSPAARTWWVLGAWTALSGLLLAIVATTTSLEIRAAVGSKFVQMRSRVIRHARSQPRDKDAS